MRFDDETPNLFENGIPLSWQIRQIPQVVRNATKKPVYIGSSYRSNRWEQSKGRPLTGDHPRGEAVDLNGVGVTEAVETALKIKNGLFSEFKKLGVNAVGFYDWGVHLGRRPAKESGEFYLWDERSKKKSDFMIWIFVAVFLFRKQLFRFLKFR